MRVCRNNYLFTLWLADKLSFLVSSKQYLLIEPVDLFLVSRSASCRNDKHGIFLVKLLITCNRIFPLTRNFEIIPYLTCRIRTEWHSPDRHATFVFFQFAWTDFYCISPCSKCGFVVFSQSHNIIMFYFWLFK